MHSAPLFAGIGGHQTPRRGRTDNWLTPPWLLRMLGGWESFDLDPSAMVDQPWPTARRHYTIADNGLLLPWEGDVWLNPPYLRGLLGRFMARMAAHGRGIALIFARTETSTFFRYVWERATAVLFPRGRIDFCTPDGGTAGDSGAPSVLCAYGDRHAAVLASVDPAFGQFVPLRLPRSVVVLALATTWRDAIADWLRAQRGPVALADIYRAFASHPKAAANPNYQAKIRQVLQLGAGVRVGRGQWSAA
ncbi:DNA N-6-adenine-methyltransferase [Bradyrhizobium erythrophlei]|uniref:DNA N-6-adenine-methyltransferase (Dam) n=1 Tax=Bradyrhizobium erythrophlei TaxID=1437360 RepID=A0A1H4NKN4_9BRAD|nr:DNA N-6-adenine-methyltransferase [Bradyrhizobium erythrophlei]SEB95465.1 DNA N-6-adenine-methyltransferase (Dam) [Bradyrhizobium erythrophlei]